MDLFQGRLDILNQSVYNVVMARPVEFDVSAAQDKALVLFWRKGYQATSLADLLAVMGIGRSSFYAAYGDKRALFLSCLDLFAKRTKDVVLRSRLEMAPLDALQYFFERNFIGASASRAHLGCMMVNTVIELADVDPELSDRAGNHLADMQTVFEQCLLEAGCAPELAAEMAAMLMLFNEGVRVSSRRRLSLQQQLAPIETTFRLLRKAIA